MNRKGQAAMEFLMTYGWAILVVLVVIGALGYFGVLNPTALLPEKCMFGVEVACKDFQLLTNQVALRLQNNIGETMLLDKFEAFQDDKASALCGTNPVTFKGKQSMQPGEVQSYSFSCNLGDKKGQKTKVYVNVWYKKGGAAGLPHRIEGEIFALVQ